MLDARYASSSLSSFEPVTAEEIGRQLRKVPAKQCSLESVPTWLIKQLADHLAPVISHLCNISIQSGHLPASQKLAVVHPRLKKPILDASALNSNRPISNLSFLSKLVERVVTGSVDSLYPGRAPRTVSCEAVSLPSISFN